MNLLLRVLLGIALPVRASEEKYIVHVINRSCWNIMQDHLRPIWRSARLLYQGIYASRVEDFIYLFNFFQMSGKKICLW